MVVNKKISELVKVTSSNATDEYVLRSGATNVSIQAQYISALSSSYALTASFAVSSSVEIKQEITSSYAETASYAYSTTILSGSTSDARNELVTKISGSSVAPITSLSASLTVTNQTISASVATLSGSASDARNLIVADNLALSASLTSTDQAISSSVALLSGSSSDARNELVTKISGSSIALITALSASLTTTDQVISSSVATLSGSASDARNIIVTDNSALSASLTTTDQAISSSVATLSGSASDARNLIVTDNSALSASLTVTDQAISSSVATLSGSASDARDLLVTKISGSSTAAITALSASLTTTDQAISASVATLSGSASDARNAITNILSSSYALTASYALSGGGDSNLSTGSVGYDILDDSFKTRASNITLSSGTTSAIIDFGSSAIFEITTPTDTTATTLNFDNAEIGMSKMVLVVNQGTAGSGTITLGQTTGTGTFIRTSSDDIVRTSSITNYLQITCIGKSGDDRTFVYTVGTAQ